MHAPLKCCMLLQIRLFPRGRRRASHNPAWTYFFSFLKIYFSKGGYTCSCLDNYSLVNGSRCQFNSDAEILLTLESTDKVSEIRSLKGLRIAKVMNYIFSYRSKKLDWICVFFANSSLAVFPITLRYVALIFFKRELE